MKIGKANKGNIPGNKGKTKETDHRIISPVISERVRELRRKRLERKVICLDTGEVFDSIKVASGKYNGHIGDVCRGIRKKACNMKGMYYDEYLKLKEEN